MKYIKISIKRHLKFVCYFLLFYSGLLYLLLFLFRRLKQHHSAIILVYHRFNEIDETILPFKLYYQSFERQMIHIKRYYDIIPYDVLLETLKNGSNFSKPSIAITIDDGLKDNYDLAFPVLKELELPAIIFLTSGFIGTERAPWVDEIYHALWNSSLNSLRFPELYAGELLDMSTPEARVNVARRIYKNLLLVDHNVKVDLTRKLLDLLGRGTSVRGAETRTMLNWDEVKEMANDNISFGAHTLSHPILSRMPFEQATYEIEQSKLIIEKNLGVRVKHFAFPNGRDEDFNEELREFCKSGLFESIATTNFGIVKKGTNPYNIPRISLDGPLFFFACELLRMFLFNS